MFDLAAFEKETDWLWRVPTAYGHGMRVPAHVYATRRMLESIAQDRSIPQLVNVAGLPGIRGAALAMPDVHEGYGFPVGGVAAFDADEGVISPGGIGYDINCGVRMLKSDQSVEAIRSRLRDLGRTIFQEVPSGVGRGGRLSLRGGDLDRVLAGGAARVVEMGYGEPVDLERTESNGVLKDALPGQVSQTAKGRGHDQLGTMGAGNHFVEVNYVETIFDEAEARRHGLRQGQVTVLIHTGSRGLGHQVATDSIRVMLGAAAKYGIALPDRELACAPFRSQEGQDYWGAMCAAANFAWANRQMITWEVREAWKQVLGEASRGLAVVYDVAHNIAKLEEYDVDGRKCKVVVHRKGATRSFPGQPVLIPGSMGTASHMLVGAQKAMAVSFGSSCHGAGRRMSRTRARNEINADRLRGELEEQGIVVNAGSRRGLTEEAPLAYKDVDEVVDVIHAAGIARKVVRLRPLAVIKG